MNIGIIVYSKTGHTLSVATKLEEKLIAKGHTAKLEQIKTLGTYMPGQGDIRLETVPDIGKYDALVLASPVEGFSLCPVMRQYLSRAGSLDGKKTALLITQFFPFSSMGGDSTIKQFKELCESKGASIEGFGVINWSKLGRNSQISKTVDALSELF